VDGNKFVTYTIHGEEKRTGGLRCTEAAGPAHLLAQEAQYRHILASAQTYEITNGILIIFSEKGALVFKRRE
jgi:heat shock protein HslJ